MELQPCTDCTKVTNNKYFNCPPRMSDGRNFTDYKPNHCDLNSIRKYEFKNTQPATSYDLRQFFIHNATGLMELNRKKAFEKNMCGPCVHSDSIPAAQGTMLPVQTLISCDQNICQVKLNNKRGLGQGRQYFTNGQGVQDEFDNATVSGNKEDCCATKFDDMQYYPLTGDISSDYGRYASPSGAIPLSASTRTPFF